MISNNTSFKLKASKGSRNNHEYPDQEDNESVDGDATGDSNHKYQMSIYSSRDGRYKPKPRNYEVIHKPYRGTDRSRPFKPRGGLTSTRRYERDYSDGSSYVNRFESGTYTYNKYYEPEKKTEIKFNLPEDTRISKLLRRLNMEDDQENSLQISKKLLEVLLLPDNAVYIRKSFTILRDSMLRIFYVAPGPIAKKQCARAFGRMGYIMGQDSFDFDKYSKVILKHSNLIPTSDEMSCLLMESLKETLYLESKNPILSQHLVFALMQELVGMIEETENVDIFKATLDNLMSCVEFYPEDFTDYFKDTTDLLFGWHVDHTQPLSNIEFISNNLQRISRHFQMNIQFSITLILHFIEDIETYTTQMIKKDLINGDNTSIEHVTCFILALNTVLKCLKDNKTNTINNELFTNTIINDALTQIVKTLTDALDLFVPDNLIIAGNESISILLGLLTTKNNTLNKAILNLVDIELSLINDLSDATIISMLLMTSKVIKELSANLPIELITKLVGPKSQIIKLRYSQFKNIQEAVIYTYQALLNLKNIPLLQEAYRCILGDLEMVYKRIVPTIAHLTANNPFNETTLIIGNDDEIELSCIFLLRCLSQLANASGSIIGMWALKPNILELLGVLLQPYCKQLLKKAPALQYSMIYLLYSHCKCYNDFISSSNLLNDKNKSLSNLGLPDGMDEVQKSPNSGNFSIILDVLYKTFTSKINHETKLLLLNWLKDILNNAEAYLETLYLHKEFIQITEVLIPCGYSKNTDVVLAVAANIMKLLANKRLSFKNTFLININKLCTLHMTSNNPEVRCKYTEVASQLPWDVAVAELGKLYTMEAVKRKQADLSNYNNYSITLAQHFHLNGTLYGEMLPIHFKKFMNFLVKNETNESNLLEAFTNCWALEMDHQELQDQFRDLAINSQPVLNNWATWESAQVCVNTKLRTPIGTPIETLTTIENCLKQLARDVLRIKPDNASSVAINSQVDQNRVRLLLQFMEHLEMCIYNASEGTAIAIPQPQKLVRSFFNTNASTCKEWLSRIRVILIQLALHVGQSTIAVRHGQKLLLDMKTNNKIDSIEFERAVMYLTISLLNLRESEAIQGLYVWCKSIANKRYDWIKCASDQANKKYEIAANGYQLIIEDLKHSDTKKIDIHVKHFISDQIIKCYKELNNWLDIMAYKNGNMNVLLSETENGMRYSFNTINFDCAQSLFKMEISSHAFNELTTWKDLETYDSWSSYDILSNVESDLYNIALNIAAPNNENIINKIDEKLTKIQNCIQDDILYLPSEFLQEFCILNYVGNGLKNVIQNTPASTVFLVSENFEEEVNKIDSCVLTKILWWSEYFAKIQNQGFSSFSSNLRLNIINKARKESNSNLASSELYRFFNNKNLLQPTENTNRTSLLINIAESFKDKVPELTMWSMDTAKAAKETIKLLYDEPKNRKLAFDLCAITSTSISKCADMYGGGIELKQISSKILLKLATWLQTNDIVSPTELTSPLGKLLMVLPEIGIENISNNIIPMNEMAIGKLLQFSVNQCTNLAKTWNAFGTWCYRWGRKIVDSSADLSNTLTNEDRANIQSLIPLDCKVEELNRILMILSQTRAYVDEEDIDSNEINTSEMIRNQLNNVPILYNAHEDLIEALVQIWRNLQKRIYAYYGHSVEAYFKYLHLSTNSDNVTKATESNTITITLRLLRLIVKHALELQNVLEEGLASTPTHPWKVIIPQLFSRLNHPESYVRERVSELLCRVAEDAPHLITFPAVVGALEGGVKFDFSEISLPKDCLSQNNESNDEAELNEIEDTYESDNDETKNVLQACFKNMVDTLSKQASETITQVQLLVKELRRIILLWDELWLGTLAQHQSEINKRQQQLELEIEKVNENVHLNAEEKISLITEKHRIIIKPIIFILEQLNDITSVEPETPHEKQFQERYSEIIDAILKKLKSPENPDKPTESWKLLKQLQTQFQQKAHKRTGLKMHDISPILANIKDTVISMPGQALRTKVHISQVSNQVSILPTKTKPKKLIFHGSDGHTYTYLFKGLEDLHLDERIMQFLSIANTMMAQNSEGTGHNLYRARHYSVIPLGPRSGLISWVGNTTPVFALYKRWQQREAAKQAKNTSNNQVLRPSELFYNKLNPLLQEHGVKNIENRKEWPLVVLKQVLSELMAETPSDLLAKELWCHSVNPGAWWQTVRKYSYSVAVMSIIGYIIGLGDRHLDNVLVDLNSGEVVHIDYNVCFEKGKTLRVPEKVPFRLTPNIRDALGVTGVEGMFRLACENILKTMKRGRETLLTLLEAFVYDPLVDWTVGNDGLAGTTFGGMSMSTNTPRRQTRKDLDKEVALAMYRVRCTEMKVEWDQNKDEIEDKIPELSGLFDDWQLINQKATESEYLLQDLHQQMALVKEAEANGICKHSLYTLPSRFETYKKTKDAVQTAKKDIDNLIKECDSHIDRYGDALKCLQSQQVSQWCLELNSDEEKDIRVFDLVKEFLQNAGQAAMISQCEQSEIEVAQLAQQQTVVALKCLSLLQEYWVICTQCPQSFLDKHRIYYYRKWCKILENACELTTCEYIYQQFCAFTSINSKPVASIMKYSYHLSVLYNNTAAQAAKVFEDLNKTRTDEPSHLLEQRYSEAKICVANFLNHEKSAAKALEFVIVSELLLLNRTFLTFETAASKSGDWLIKLTSRDGDWFLDELALSSSKAIELIGYLAMGGGINDDLKLMPVVNGLQAANNMYKSLHALNFNFHTIILPESIKKIQNEESSVIQMIHDLKSIIHSLGIGLPDLVVQLEKYLTCVVMEMELSPTYEIIQNKVTNLKLQYQALLHTTSSVLSPGEMLLMGFNGLFDSLNLQSNNIVNTLGNVEVPLCWRKLDQVKDAKSLAAPIFNAQIHAILDDIFLLKRLHAMYEFFTLCTEMCISFQGQENVLVFNDEQLVKPIRKFIADFISRQFLGITTEAIAYVICFLLERLGLDVTNEIEQKDIGAENKVPLDELYHKGWGIFLKNGVFTQNVLAQASSLENNLRVAWEKMQEPKKIEKAATLLQSSMQRIQNQITAHNWLFEEILTQNTLEKSLRNKFITDLSKRTNKLNTLHCKLIASREQQKNLIASAGQRLKWAVGANSDLSEVMSAFEDAVTNREKRLDVEQQIAAQVLSTCTTILHHEILRNSTDESKKYDAKFLRSHLNWTEACQYQYNKIDAVSAVEENIMKLYTPAIGNNSKWVSDISEKISDAILETQKDLQNYKNNLLATSTVIVTVIERFKAFYAKHCKIMNDFKSLIKSMVKIDDCCERTQQFVIDYRNYVDNFNTLIHRFKKEVNEDDVNAAIQVLEYVKSHTESVYESLWDLEGNYLSASRGGKALLVRQEGMSISPSKMPIKQESMTKGQQRNAYAVGVWRRVRMKLEGKDPDPGRKYTTQEQVDYVIREAGSLDNLALLYEGWTPWV